MKREEYRKVYRGFEVLPFADNGLVKRLSGEAETVDSKGYRTIRGANGKKFMVSHIVYAVGSGFPKGFSMSISKMKNYIIKYKNGDKTNCNYDNLVCIMKQKYRKQLKREKEIASYFS